MGLKTPPQKEEAGTVSSVTLGSELQSEKTEVANDHDPISSDKERDLEVSWPAVR